MFALQGARGFLYSLQLQKRIGVRPNALEISPGRLRVKVYLKLLPREGRDS